MATALLIVAALLGVAVIAVAVWHEAGEPLPARDRPRPRRLVGPEEYERAQRLGFRYSSWRDALVLRVVGERFGPVLQLREDPSAAKRPRDVPERSRRGSGRPLHRARPSRPPRSPGA